MMQQRKRLRESLLSSFFDELELEVAAIFLQLPTLIISESESSGSRCLQLPNWIWGSRRRRSIGNSAPCSIRPGSATAVNSPPPSLICCPSSSPPQPPSSEFQVKAKVKVEVTSPVTPLCFFPTDTDDTPSRSSTKRYKKKMTHKQLMAVHGELCGSNAVLVEEVEKARRLRDHLLAKNFIWKEMRQDAELLEEKTRRSRLMVKLEQQHSEEPSSMATQQRQQQPPPYGCKAGPLRIPSDNVNMSGEAFRTETWQPLDPLIEIPPLSRIIRAAQARKRRMLIIKNKFKRPRQCCSS